MTNIIFPQNCRGVIDLTKSPYNLDPTGHEDCTERLGHILDELLQRQIDGVQDVARRLAAMPGDVAVIGIENYRKGDDIQAIFPDINPQVPALYFPNGTYLVSDTIAYSLRNLRNTCCSQTPGGHELNRMIRIIGQSRDGVVIKLRDHCRGFEFGNERPLVSFMRGERTNVAMSNFIENLTLDVGTGNPGAVGLLFYANNSGAVRNVTIRSSDPEGCGAIGLAISHEIYGSCVRDVSVEGFDYGLKITPARNYAAFENVTVRNQLRYGVKIEQTIASFHNLKSLNQVPAVIVTGTAAHVVITDSELVGTDSRFPAIQIELGCVFLRNIHTQGYASAVNRCWGYTVLPDGTVDQYCTHDMRQLFDNPQATSLALPTEPFPEDSYTDDLAKWIGVNAFGAVGDGRTDDTDAIQAAMNSGNPTIWFQPGHYLLSHPVVIPASVNHVHFMYCDFFVAEQLREARGSALFVVRGDSPTTLTLEKLFTWENCLGYMHLIQHDSTRTLYLRDIHTQDCATYFNSARGGKVFLEDVACTTANRRYRCVPAFHFAGQRVRSLCMNPERSEHEIINDGGTLWLMGFKTEGDGPLIETYNGGYSEILGGTCSIGTNNLCPIVLNDNSNVSVVCSTNGYNPLHLFPVAVEEKRENRSRYILHNTLPCRMPPFFIIPLYIGYSADCSGLLKPQNEPQNENVKVLDLY